MRPPPSAPAPAVGEKKAALQIQAEEEDEAIGRRRAVPTAAKPSASPALRSKESKDANAAAGERAAVQDNVAKDKDNRTPDQLLVQQRSRVQAPQLAENEGERLVVIMVRFVFAPPAKGAKKAK